jgi:hypothetical protein
VRKHRKLLIVLACLAVITVVVVFATRDNEPQCKGLSLSEWFQASLTGSATPDDIDPEHAVREIGTNAIPCLLKWIRCEPTPWQKTVRRRFPKSFLSTDLGSLISGESAEKKVPYATLGFIFLGTNATTAIPELQSMLQDKTHPEIAINAIEALASTGSPAFPTLAAAFADKGHDLRYGILYEVVITNPERFNPHQITNLLRSAFEDPKASVRSLATNAARHSAPELLTNAPAK